MAKGFYTQCSQSNDSRLERKMYQQWIFLHMVEIPYAPEGSQKYLNLSVYSEVKRYWSKIDRTIVTVGLNSHSVSCPCSVDKHYCTHKVVVKWLLKQQMPSQFISSSIENEDDIGELFLRYGIYKISYRFFQSAILSQGDIIPVCCFSGEIHT